MKKETKTVHLLQMFPVKVFVLEILFLIFISEHQLYVIIKDKHVMPNVINFVEHISILIRYNKEIPFNEFPFYSSHSFFFFFTHLL